MLHLPHSRAALLPLLVVPLAAICGASGATAGALAAAPAPTGSHLARREAVLAAGARRLAAALGHVTTAVSCRVHVSSVRPAGDGAVTVTARAVTLVTWSDRAGRTDTEGEGLDHVLTLVCRHGRWLVTADAYDSDLTPRLLESGGASRRAVAVAARSLESRARAASVRAALDGLPAAPTPASSSTARTPASAPLRVTPGYVAKLMFDRSAAKALRRPLRAVVQPHVHELQLRLRRLRLPGDVRRRLPAVRRHVRLRLVVRQARHERARQRHLQPRLDRRRQPAGRLEQVVSCRRLAKGTR